MSTRLEEDAGVITIPKNYEYEGQLLGFREIADDTQEASANITNEPTWETVQAAIQILVRKIENRIVSSQLEVQVHEKYKRDYRGMMLYYRPLGVESACNKVLEWLEDMIQAFSLSVERRKLDI
jgi:hypothetical protein